MNNVANTETHLTCAQTNVVKESKHMCWFNIFRIEWLYFLNSLILWKY